MKIKRKNMVIAVLLLLALTIPIRTSLKDGGTVSYQAILYGITKQHSMTIQNHANGYDIGTIVRILFFTVYDDVHFVSEKETNE